MATIGSLAVNIVAVTDKFMAGINKARGAMGGFAAKATSLTGILSSLAGTGAIGAMLHQFDEAGSTLHDMANRTAVSVENLSALKYAAEQSGSSIGALSTAFRFMQKNGLDPNAFFQVAAGIAAIKDPTERAQAALKILGKRGTELLPMINELPQLRAEFERLGGGVTTKMAQQADALGDSWGKLRVSMGNVANHIAAALAPTITQLNEYIAQNIKSTVEWIDKHSTLIAWIGGATSALGPLTAAAWAFNTAVIAITTSLTALKAVASAGVIAKILTAIAASEVAIPIAAGAGALAVGYGINKYVEGKDTGARGWDVEVKNNTQKQVDQQKQTNDLLRQSLGRQPVVLQPAGVR